MDWKTIYEQKLVSVEAVAKEICSNDVVFTSASVAAPVCVIDEVVERTRRGEIEGVKFVGNQELTKTKMVQAADLAGKISYNTQFYDAYDRLGYENGTVYIDAVPFSRISRSMKEYYHPNVLLVEMSEPDENGYCYFGASGGGFACDFLHDSMIKKILVIINKYMLKANSTVIPGIHVSEITAMCRNDHEMPTYKQPEVTDIDRQVAANILPLIPDGATIQIGRGGLANAIGYGLENKKNLSIHSEILTDSLVELAKKGIITGTIRVGSGFGSQEVSDFCASERVDMWPFSKVNDPYVIGSYDNFISINSCLMLDLTGQVCSESIGYRQYSSIGGQLDFVKGAALSKGGKSFITVRSTHIDKATGKPVSNIMAKLPEGAVVTTPRAETMYIVTEYGAANLFLRPIEERVKSLIAIAHPDFREELREQAIKMGILKRFNK